MFSVFMCKLDCIIYAYINVDGKRLPICTFDIYTILAILHQKNPNKYSNLKQKVTQTKKNQMVLLISTWLRVRYLKSSCAYKMSPP